MTHPDSDGINEMVEGAHRAVGTGLSRWTEMLAWRGRDRAYDHADAANRDVEQALAERDLAAAGVDRWVSIPDPDDDRNMPVYEGPVAGAAGALRAGRYTGYDENGNAVTVTVPPGAASAPGGVGAEELVDYPARAGLHARTHAELDGREFFDDTDVDSAVTAWAASRDAEAGQPAPDSPHWRQWALLEATDEQIEKAHAAVSDRPEEARLAAAYHHLQDQVETAAAADATWRAAADQRAAKQADRVRLTGSAQKVAAGAGRRDRVLAHGFSKDLTESLLLHDLTFGAPVAAARSAKPARRPAPATRARRQRQRGLSR